MGEKGNITSEELAAGGGAVLAGAGTHVSAVFREAGETITDKVIDKGADAGIAGAQERWRARRDEETTDGEPPPQTPTT